MCVCLHCEQVIGCAVHDSINRSYAIEAVTPWALGDSKQHFQGAGQSSRGPAEKQESKFWVQVTTHGRLAIGARGEQSMGIPLRICLMREMMMGSRAWRGWQRGSLPAGSRAWPAHGKVTSLTALRGGIASRADLHLQGSRCASARL